jgi:hypothetical protein
MPTKIQSWTQNEAHMKVLKRTKCQDQADESSK